MRDVFNLKIKNGKLTFRTPYHKALFNDFVKLNEGKKIKVSISDSVSSQLRKFFEGAIVPYFALQHFVVDPQNNQWCIMPYKEARECLKREFNPTFFRDITGKSVMEGKSTNELNKKEFVGFVERCLQYFDQNGYEVPISEEYNQWVDSIPDEEEYPQLSRLKELAYKKLLELNGYAPDERILSRSVADNEGF